VADSASEAADLASEAVDLARDTSNSAREAADLASGTVDSARDVADLASKATNHPRNKDRKPLILMTWNVSRLLSSGRELALMNLLISSAVDIATVTECEMSETANNFAVAG
jgi:hypothetical protein